MRTQRGRGGSSGGGGTGEVSRGMAARSRRAWFSVLLGLVLGFTLASRLILPRATELKKGGHARRDKPAACGLTAAAAAQRKERAGAALLQWPPPDNGSPATEKPGSRSNNFLFVGVMTAQKYLRSRAVAAHRYELFSITYRPCFTM